MKLGILADSNDHKAIIAKAVAFFNTKSVNQENNPGELCAWFASISTVVLLDTETNEVTIHEL